METRNTKAQPIRLGYSQLLSFIEKNAQSSFLKTIITTLGSRAIVIILGFFTSIIVARTLGPVGRGYLGLATTLTGLGVQLGLLGFHSSNTFYVSKNPSLLPTMISNSILISCIIGGLTTVTLFFMRYLIIGDTSLPLPLLLISLALIPLNICFLLFQGLLTGIQKFKHYNLSEVFNKSIHVFLILAFFFIGTFSVTTIILFQGIAITASLIFMFSAFPQPIKTWKAPSFSLIKKNFFYGGKAYLACFFGWGITRMDIFILQRSQGFEEVGYFSVALSLIDILRCFPLSSREFYFLSFVLNPTSKKNGISQKKPLFAPLLLSSLDPYYSLYGKPPLSGCLDPNSSPVTKLSFFCSLRLFYFP